MPCNRPGAEETPGPLVSPRRRSLTRTLFPLARVVQLDEGKGIFANEAPDFYTQTNCYFGLRQCLALSREHIFNTAVIIDLPES